MPMLLKVWSSQKFLLRQGLAIRGHKESEGNLLQLLHLRSDDCPKLVRWLRNQQYMSPEIINEVIAIMGHDLLRKLLSSIHSATWYAILADETADIANYEQLSMSIRWVGDAYKINEDFTGLVHVPRTTSDTLTAAIKDVLVQCSLPVSRSRLRRGLKHDGSPTWSCYTDTGRETHCYHLAHGLNLCLQDAAKKCMSARNALDILMEISKDSSLRCCPEKLSSTP